MRSGEGGNRGEADDLEILADRISGSWVIAMINVDIQIVTGDRLVI